MFNWLRAVCVLPAKLREKGILGMNARNYSVIAQYNSRRLYPLVDDKVQTKSLALKAGVQTPNLIGVIAHQYEVENILAMVKNHREFVIKPAHGSGGKGVMVVRGYEGGKFTLASGKVIDYNEVYQHVSNILSGLYSLGGQYDSALLEEMVHFSDAFKDYSYCGVPDVRVIVYKGYPIMAMTRLATAESGGRANLHQGAVGVGLDIKTGRTKCAVQHNMPITQHPDTKADLRKIEVPLWREHLLIAAKAYEMTGLGYFGADIVLDAQKGPMMLELNARPGLAIQIANGEGLKKVIKKVDKYYPKSLPPEKRIDYILR
ncbi:MAG: alpha-L-glutamate ligase-like protein [Alphaproteobacteria bacterium]|nr:alpha-L-glutamate ligase-like protein [Alphaproteobacteria bacterium]